MYSAAWNIGSLFDLEAFSANLIWPSFGNATVVWRTGKVVIKSMTLKYHLVKEITQTRAQYHFRKVRSKTTDSKSGIGLWATWEPHDGVFFSRAKILDYPLHAVFFVGMVVNVNHNRFLSAPWWFVSPILEENLQIR
jgi:hypothetical protein